MNILNSVKSYIFCYFSLSYLVFACESCKINRELDKDKTSSESHKKNLIPNPGKDETSFIGDDQNKKLHDKLKEEINEKAEKVYNELNMFNVNLDKKEVLDNIKENQFNKEKVQNWIDSKKSKAEEDPMKQKQTQANQIYEEIKNQFPNHDNLINKDDIINKLINNNLNKNEIINDINKAIKEIQQKENEAKAEQIYNELNMDNVNLDKKEVLDYIKENHFNKEKVQNWIDSKKPKEEEDKMIQKQTQANQIYEEIKNQFAAHNNLINKDEIINKLINNNLNKNEIINDINNKIKEISQKENEAKAEQIYNELNLNNINIDKNEIISIIKEKNFDKEEIKKWLDEKAKIQNKQKAQNLYNNLRNGKNLDFSKCSNEEAILNKIIELKFNENEIRNFFKAAGKEKEEGGNDDQKVIEIFNELEDGYNLTSLKEKEEIIEKIKELKCDREKINEWLEEVVAGNA